MFLKLLECMNTLIKAIVTVSLRRSDHLLHQWINKGESPHPPSDASLGYLDSTFCTQQNKMDKFNYLKLIHYQLIWSAADLYFRMGLISPQDCSTDT